jgi:hypothetical protein
VSIRQNSGKLQQSQVSEKHAVITLSEIFLTFHVAYDVACPIAHPILLIAVLLGNYGEGIVQHMKRDYPVLMDIRPSALLGRDV